MSTKIYTAWRCPVRKLPNFLDWADNVVMKKIKADCRRVLSEANPDPDLVKKYRKHQSASMAKKAANLTVFLALEIKDAELGGGPDLLRAWLNIWVRNQYAYLIAGGLSFCWSMGSPDLGLNSMATMASGLFISIKPLV